MIQKFLRILSINKNKGAMLYKKHPFMVFCIALLNLAAISSYSQTITGNIKDIDGMGLPGVNIIEKGTSNGTISDLDGNFSITVSDRSAILIFSFVGYITQEIAVGDQTQVNVILEEDIAEIEGVVVIGYGTVKKSDVTGSLASITAETLEERPVTNALQAIQGKAAGVDVFSNTRPGEVPGVLIRGNKTLTGSTSPLIVVDGIIFNGNLNDINPNDISSIEILKDASATSIYGSRGGNGVILITTKKGTKGKATVNYSFSHTMDKIHSLTEWADAGDAIDRQRLAYINGRQYNTRNRDIIYPDPASDIALFGHNDYWTINAIRQGYEWEDPGTYENVRYRSTTAAEQDMGWPDTVPVYNSANIPSYDWLDLLTQTGVTNEHNLSISSGTENASVYLSVGYLNNEGTQLNQSYKRYTTKLNGDLNVTKWLTVGTAITLSKSEQEYGTINRTGSATGAKDLYGVALTMMPMGQPYDTLGELIDYPGGDAASPTWNPLFNIETTQDLRMRTYIQGSMYGEVKFTPWLRYRVNFGVDVINYKNGTWQGKESTLRRNAVTPTASAGLNIRENFNWMVENMLYFDKTIGIHSFGATLLQSAQAFQTETSYMNADRIINDAPKWHDLGANFIGTISDYGTGYSARQLASYMGRVNYTLMDKYLFTATARYDGSSVLAPGHQWDVFPSFAFAWKAHEESFLQPLSFISQLKPRIGYGVNGNATVPAYVTAGPLKQYDYIFGTVAATGYIPGAMPNPYLGWEKTKQVNLGLDFGFLRNRITGNIDVYKSNIYDLLMKRDLPAITGFTETTANIGKMKNRGIEFALSTVNVSTNDFSWKTDINFSANREEIVELVNGKEDMEGNGWYIGQPASIYRNYEIAGIWQDTPEDSVEMSLWTGQNFMAGQYKPVDRNGNHMLEDSDKVIIGTPNPKWVGGITNTFTYKGLSLSFFMYARIGQTYFGNLQPGGTGSGSYLRYMKAEDINNFWSPENPNAEYPQPNSRYSNANVLRGTYYNDGSFIIVRNINLTYDFPKTMLDKVNISNLQVYVQVLNPFIFGRDVVKAGINPDDNTNWGNTNSVGDPVGGTNNNTIMIRSLGFGARVGL